MGICHRLTWPGDFQTLTADRVAKGFSVVQVVAGLYPDMGAFDERGANEAGFPWQTEWRGVNPAYFDMADLRINWLVRSGIAPCIVGGWGYYVHWLGEDRMKRHWRYLVARYAALPVVWCLCGEMPMPYYLDQSESAEGRRAYHERTRDMWRGVTRYVREIDPFARPITVHPSGSSSARGDFGDDCLDFDMLQSSHSAMASVPGAVDQVAESYGRAPIKPVLNAEPCYDGIGESGREEVQRMLFWTSILSGAAGHTYGASGIWQVNTRSKLYGPSPHGMSWGDTPWEEAYQLPASQQLGLGKRLLERYRWWEFAPHPEWIEPHASAQNRVGPYAAGVPRHARVIFIPAGHALGAVREIEPDVQYRAFYFNPSTADETDLDTVRPDSAHAWRPPRPPIFRDWVLVLTRTDQ